MIVLVACQEVQEQRRLREAPLLALAETEDVAEQLLRLLAVQEVCLIRCALIGIARSGHDAVHAHRHDFIEEGRNAFRNCAVEQGAVDGDAETTGLRKTDRCGRTLENAFLTDGGVMHELVAIQMHVPGEEREGS